MLVSRSLGSRLEGLELSVKGFSVLRVQQRGRSRLDWGFQLTVLRDERLGCRGFVDTHKRT